MSKDIIVSVMITYYNQKAYIKDSLGSVITQETNFLFEIICGDDGSCDGTYEELISWQERYPDIIKVIQMPREAGKKYEPIIRVSNSRCIMWKQARGKYVSFLDGDDYYTNRQKLQKQVDLMEKNPRCTGCGQPALMLWENDINRKQEISKIFNRVYIIPKKQYWGFYWFHADTFLYRNILIEKHQDINPLFFDDNLITCYFIKYGDVIYSPDDMTVYRQVDGSSWNKRTNLQKAYVNLSLYCESKRILGWNLCCFVNCLSAWKAIYNNRYEKFDLSNESSTIVDIIMKNSFLKETMLFSKYGFIKKAKYYLKYFIPVHSEIIFKVFRRIGIVTYKKI